MKQCKGVRVNKDTLQLRQKIVEIQYKIEVIIEIAEEKYSKAQ